MHGWFCGCYWTAELGFLIFTDSLDSFESQSLWAEQRKSTRLSITREFECNDQKLCKLGANFSTLAISYQLQLRCKSKVWQVFLVNKKAVKGALLMHKWPHWQMSATTAAEKRWSALATVGELERLTITIFPSVISRTNLVSLPSHFCTCTSLSPSMVKVDCKKHKHISRQMARWRWTSSSSSHSRPSAHFDVAVIRCGLIELLSQLGGELGVPEGAQGFHHHLVSILADDDCRFGDVAHLSCGKTNTCTRRCRKFSDVPPVKKWLY